MEYVAGRTLTEAIGKQGLPVEEVLLTRSQSPMR